MSRIYRADGQSNSLTVIDGSTDKITAVIPVGPRPGAVAINQNTNKTYVAHFGVPPGISEIDDLTSTVDYNFPVSPPFTIAINPTTNRLYSADTNGVTIIDLSTRTIVGSVAVGFQPVGIAANPVTNRIYVASQGTSDVSVIDGSTNTVTASIMLMNYPGIWGIDVDPSMNRIYVASHLGPISIIDGKTNTIMTSIPCTCLITTLVLNPVLKEFYVAHQWSYFGGPPPYDRIDVWNMTTNTEITSIVVGSDPHGIGLDSLRGRVYVDGDSSDTISVIDAATLVVTDTIAVDPTISASPAVVTLTSGGTGNSTVTVKSYADNRLASYNFYVYANSSAGFHFTTINLIVGDYAVSSSVSSLNLPAGFPFSIPITIASLTGSWTVVLNSTSNQNVKMNFNPSTVSISNGTSATSTLYVDPSALNTAQNLTLTVTGKSGTWWHSTTLYIRLDDFAISPSSPALTLQKSSSASLPFTLNSVNGFSGTTSLAVTSISSSSLTCNLNITSLILITTAYVRLTCTGHQAGNYEVVVAASSGPLVHYTSIPVTVSQAPTGGGPPPPGSPYGNNSLPTSVLETLTLVLVAVVGLFVFILPYRRRKKKLRSNAPRPGLGIQIPRSKIFSGL